MSATANPNPDWYPDPTGRFEQRYWDGSQWTEHVSSAGQQRVDPLPGGPDRPAATADLPGLGDVAGGAEPASGPAPAAGPAAAGPPPDWYPDPTGRYGTRYWDGTSWTEHVTAGGQQGVDPLPDEAPGGGVGDLDESAAPEVESPADDTGSGPDPGPAATDTDSAPSADEAPEGANPFAAAAEVEPDLGPVPGIDAPGGYVVNDEGQLVGQGTGPADDAEPAGQIPVADSGPPPVGSPEPTVGGDGPVTEAASVVPGAAAGAGPAPDWYPDPTGRQELRYWDGTRWTEHASTGGQPVVDPVT